MPLPQKLSNAKSELRLPCLSLSGCVRGVMLRDTRGVTLGPTQRFNHYPATPLCSISWYLQGNVDLLEPGYPSLLTSPRHTIKAPVVFSGPQTQPVVTWCQGAGHGLMLLLLPDAMALLTDLQPGHWLNRTVDVAQVLPDSWLGMCEQVRTAAEDSARFDAIERFLIPRWQACRPERVLQAQRYADWLQGLLLRAATSRMGRSLRQVERRMLEWAGQPIRELRGFARAERTFFDLMSKAEHMPMDWVGLAMDNAFSDQSHLCRVSRRMTGFSPTALRQKIAHDEGFWPYRIWQ